VRAALLVLLAGCAQLIEPEVGPPARAACSDVDSDPEHDVSFAQDVGGIIDEYHCRDCHTPGGKTPIGLEVGGLDLSSYDTLRVGGTRSGAAIIVPAMPCSSVLLQKVSAGPPFGARMPLDGPTYLEADDLQLISDWIAEGARDN
jgi:hypothetical protein